MWASVDVGKLYWIPGTKIIGAIDAGDSSAVNADPDNTRIVDDDGHGTGSSSVSTGNRYGYCPTCLLAFVESLDTTFNESFPWVDITSHSFGTVGGVPLGLVFGEDEDTKAAAERGQTVLNADQRRPGLGEDQAVRHEEEHREHEGPGERLGAVERDLPEGLEADDGGDEQEDDVEASQRLA